MAQQLLLNEYENLGEIGVGSFAKVYKVRHAELDYIRAIRVLNTLVPDKQDKSYETFLRECKVLLRLGNGGHPNIVRIYKPDLLQGHALVEMDYIDGCDLNDYLKEQNHFISLDEVLRFSYEIGGALAYCHIDCYEFSYDINKAYEYKLEGKLKGQTFTIEADPNDGKNDLITDLQRRELIREYGITHNDLHSRNIMRRKYDGGYILLDFGLAIQDGKAVKSSSHRDGAIEYKAPEKSDKDSVISEQSDVYSFGILMYEMLAGQVPFPYNRDKYSREEGALYALSLQHENEQPPAIEPLRRAAYEVVNPGGTYEKDYPDWLEQMIMKCLNKNPEDRYANAKEFFLELKTQMAKTDLVDYKAVTELKLLNDTLNRNLSSFAYENAELSGRVDSLTRKLANTATEADNELRLQNEVLSSDLSSLRNENTELKNQVGSLSEQLTSATFNADNAEIVRLKGEVKALDSTKRKTNTIWIGLCLLFVVSTAAFGFMYSDLKLNGGQQSPKISADESNISLLEQENENLRTQLDQAMSTNRQLTNENQMLRANSDDSSVLLEKQQEIDQLQTENTTLKANQRNSTLDQSTITANQNEITRLRQEVASLKSSIQTKDRTIATQKQELQTAQSTIEKLAQQ